MQQVVGQGKGQAGEDCDVSQAVDDDGQKDGARDASFGVLGLFSCGCHGVKPNVGKITRGNSVQDLNRCKAIKRYCFL